MPRRIWNDGMEVIEGDLSAVSASLEKELYDRIIYEMIKRQQNVVFGDSFTCSYVNATTSQVKLGNGFYYDNTQVDPEPLSRALRVASNSNVTHAAADPSNNRIDIICITPARAVIQTASRNYKDPTTGAVSLTTQNVETDWQSTLSVVTGTPSGSPAVPSTPAGAIKLAEVLVTASTGIAGAGAYTDKRPRFAQPSSWETVVTKTANYTADLDDEVIEGNGSGGTFDVTLPPIALCKGKRYKLINIGATGTVNLKGNSTDLIGDNNTQALTGQGGVLSVIGGSSQWWMT